MESKPSVFKLISREQAENLMSYDHHRVRVGNQVGIMLTYQWMMLEALPDTLELEIVFHPAAMQHPPAPDFIQAVIDVL